MIYIKLEGHTFLYYIENIIRMYYKDEEIKLIENEPPEDISRGIFVISRLIYSEGMISSEVELLEKGNSIKNNKTIIRNEYGSELEATKVLKKSIQRQLYAILEEKTGKSMPWGVLVGIRPAKIVSDMLSEGMPKEKILDRLLSKYKVSEQKAELLYDVAKTEEELLKRTKPDMVSIYIGIPFCTTRCLYCSFTSNSIDRYRKQIDNYLDALEAELQGIREIINLKGFMVQSIYIGGGTPTSLDNVHLKKLLDMIASNIDMGNIEEYTLEAGRPDSINREKLETIKSGGVGRISINPQTMNDETLKLIGRKHTATDIVNSFKLARETGFDNINMDVIAGLPGEDIRMFENTLKEISLLGPENLTIHTMSIKRASELADNIDKYQLSKGEEVSGMVDLGQKYAQEMGLHPYYLYRQKNILGNLENIGYCKPGFESIYNIQIMEEKQTILALGAGAVTKVVYRDENRIERAFNVKSVEEYLLRVKEMVERKRVLLI